MPRVRLRTEVPDDALVRFSREHPEAELRTLTSRRTGTGVSVLIEATAVDPLAIADALDSSPEIQSFEALDTGHDWMLFQIVMPENPARETARNAGFLPQYPMVLRDGWQTIEAVISHDRLSALKRTLDAEDIAFEVLSIEQVVDEADLLTDRQWEVLSVAIARGYYDTPRECTLTDLAEGFGVNPSGISGVLHRAEELVVKRFAAHAKRPDAID